MNGLRFAPPLQERRTIPTLALALLSLTAVAPAKAQPEPIRDNSFLIEEAFNQEAGVIQHIFAFERERGGAFGLTFTEEWPVKSETHQLSLTLPVNRVPTTGTNSFRVGAGDALLNYRYQAASFESRGVALAPRLSLIVPSGSRSKGTGTGRFGVDANLPASFETKHQRLALHLNAGGAFVPNGSTSGPGDFRRLQAGASLIYYAHPSVNLMLEFVTAGEREGAAETTTSRALLPGLRFAKNFKSGLQIVPGIGVPIQVGGAEPGAAGIFLYLSFEHPLKRP